LQTTHLMPKYFSMHLLRRTTIPLSHLKNLSVTPYCHLINAGHIQIFPLVYNPPALALSAQIIGMHHQSPTQECL
jgi:hypothetical protein